MSAVSKETVHQLTPRDIICLTWIAMQYAIRLDQLQRLLYRHIPEADRYKLKPGADRLSLDRSYEMIAKSLGWGDIEKGGILHRDKLWLWVPREWLRTARLPFSYSGKPASSRLPHLFYINQIRLYIEEKRPEDTWTSERQIRKDAGAPLNGENQPHLPDAILTAAKGKVTALEIERSPKTEDELLDDLRELTVSYKSVRYFASGSTKRQVEARLEDFTREMRKPFRIYSLVKYGGTAYGIS